MLIHYKILTRRVSLSREASVCCEKCAADFVYTLTRIGTGRAIVLMFIGEGAAVARAQRAAARDAERRVAREQDLVPCPKCGWVNREAIRRYRVAGGGMLLIVAIAAAIVIFLCALGLQVSEIHFRASRDLLGAILWSTLATMVVLPIALIVHVSRRLSLNPNRRFPAPPTPPPGTPVGRLKGSSIRQRGATPPPLPQGSRVR